jgi:lysophospholipase L1-like esterase
VRSQFAYWLARARPHWRVLNRGVTGERSDEIAARFDRDVLGHDPQVVVIIAGVNDVYQGRDVAYVTTQLAALYSRTAAAGLAIVAGTIVPYNTATPEQNARMRAINAWIADTTRREELGFADTRAAAAAADNPDMLASSLDGLHPDVDGYRRMADALLAPIAAALTMLTPGPRSKADGV